MSVFIFVVYLVMLVAIGFVTFRKTKSYDDFTLGGRSNNKWVTALSTESTDMSSWLLLGLPGMAFTSGYGSIWLLIGLLFGTFFNWAVVAGKLRRITEYYHSITLMEFFERRLGDKSGVLATIAGLVIVVFMTVNSSAEVIGSGKLMSAAFGVSYRSGMYIGIAIALVYTFLGGFLAVSWSNLVQGTLMIIALVLVPAAALSRVGGGSGLATSLLSQDKNLLSLFSGVTGFWPIVALITGGLGVGICYPGQPHVITTYMGIKDPKEVKASTVIAMIWVGVTCYGAVIIGMMGRSMFPTIEDPEQTFLLLAKTLFSAKMIGFFAAAVMSALLSSLSAYLLTAAASFASGTYRRLAKVTDDRKLVVVQRVAIVVIAAIAMLLSLQGGLVYKIALFATAGLGACFAPLVLFSLYSSRVNTKGAIWSMVVGMATVLLWWTLGLSNYVYEAVPGLIASTITLLIVSKLTGGPDKSVKETFLDFFSKDTHRKSLHVGGETRVNQ